MLSTIININSTKDYIRDIVVRIVSLVMIIKINIKLKLIGVNIVISHWNFPGGSVVKHSPVNTGDVGSIPGSQKSPGEGNGNPLQYSYWEIQ